jgi:hypothetical protein
MGQTRSSSLWEAWLYPSFENYAKEKYGPTALTAELSDRLHALARKPTSSRADHLRGVPCLQPTDRAVNETIDLPKNKWRVTGVLGKRNRLTQAGLPYDENRKISRQSITRFCYFIIHSTFTGNK